jgi:WD40 repeat protein
MVAEGQITGIAFSPDSRWVLTASLDGTVRAWEAMTGRPIEPPLVHDAAVTELDLSGDGRRLATVCADKSVLLWRITLPAVSARGNPGSPWSAQGTSKLHHSHAVRSVRFSPTQTEVLTVSDDQAVRVWDAVRGTMLSDPMRHADRVLAAEFSSDGKRLLTAARDRTLRVWDARTGHALTEPLLHADALVAAFLSLDASQAVSVCRDGTVWIRSLPVPARDPPSWLLDLAQALSGGGESEDGRGRAGRWEQLAGVKEALARATTNDPLAAWGRSFFRENRAEGGSVSATGGTGAD